MPIVIQLIATLDQVFFATSPITTRSKNIIIQPKLAQQIDFTAYFYILLYITLLFKNPLFWPTDNITYTSHLSYRIYFIKNFDI